MAEKIKHVYEDKPTNGRGKLMSNVPVHHKWYMDMPKFSYLNVPDENWIRAFGRLGTIDDKKV